MRMRLPTAYLTPALLLLALGWLASPASAAGDKVTICHIPPGNPENVQVIEVSPSAAQKHIDRHGDSLFGAVELCDGLDNDCDGFVDEDFRDQLGQVCADGISDCRQTGEQICDPDDPSQTTCSAVADDPLEPGGEVTCGGGADEDCDDLIDCADVLDCAWDGDPTDLTCKDPVCPDGIVDAGEACDGGVCCNANCSFAGPGTPCGIDEVCRQEVCDLTHECVVENYDSTCDTDPPGPNNACDASADRCQEGVCTNTDPNPIQEIPCNGIDDNCNGDADEVPSGPCNSGLEGICQDGVEACGAAAGEVICVANVMPGDVPELGIELCIDGLDNDCDGLKDFNTLSDPIGDPDCGEIPEPQCPCYTIEEIQQSAETSCDFQGFAGLGGVLSSRPGGLFVLSGGLGSVFCGFGPNGDLVPEELVLGCELIMEEALGGCVSIP